MLETVGPIKPAAKVSLGPVEIVSNLLKEENKL
jgi:hypothetical protein